MEKHVIRFKIINDQGMIEEEEYKYDTRDDDWDQELFKDRVNLFMKTVDIVSVNTFVIGAIGDTPYREAHIFYKEKE